MAHHEVEPSVPPPAGKYLTRAIGLALVFGAGGAISYYNAAVPNNIDTEISTYATLVPDMSGFLSPGSKDTCYNGGARPCAMLIRSEPSLESAYVNATPAQRRVKWPLESYDGDPGDDVVVECYQTGQTVYSLDGSSSSSVWYRVIVPPGGHIKNQEVSQNMENGTIRTIQYAGEKALLAYAAAEWFGQTEPAAGIDECNG